MGHSNVEPPIFQLILGCLPPRGWCSHSGSSFQHNDCDQDGIQDCLCTDNSGKMWTKLSTKGFKEDKPGVAKCRSLPRKF